MTLKPHLTRLGVSLGMLAALADPKAAAASQNPIVLEVTETEILNQGTAPVAFEWIDEATAGVFREPGRDDRQALVGHGDGAIVRARLGGELPLKTLPSFWMGCWIFPEALGTAEDPATLISIGAYPGPGAVLGLALAGPDTVQVVRYANGQWRNDSLPLDRPLRAGEWQSLAFSIQQTSDGGNMKVSVWIDGREAGHLVSEHGLGAQAAATELVLGGAGARGRNFRGRIQDFVLAESEELPAILHASSDTTAGSSAQQVAKIEFLSSNSGARENWLDPRIPNRVRLKLAQPASGRVVIDLSADQLVLALSAVSQENLSLESFAFEKARLALPDRTEIAGGFRLLVDNRNLIRNGRLQAGSDGRPPAWSGFNPERMKLTTAEIRGTSQPVLLAEGQSIANVALTQPLRLQPGEFYLLTAWLRRESRNGELNIQLRDPVKPYFADCFSSYVPITSPPGQWTEERTLAYPTKEDVEVAIFAGLDGRGEIGDISLRPASWKLVVDLPKPTSEILLYVPPRAGHRLTVPHPELCLTEADLAKLPVRAATTLVPEALTTTPFPFLAQSEAVTVWAVPPETPLRAETLPSTKPASVQPNAPVSLWIPRGGAASFAIVVDAGAETLDLTASLSEMPLQAELRRLAPIPIYDGPHPNGKRVEVRFDAMTPLDMPDLPESSSGLHLIGVTLRVPEDAPAGKQSATVTLSLGSHGANGEQTLTIPLEVEISPVVVRPMEHFAVIFGANHFLSQYNPGPNLPFTEKSISVAKYHGFHEDNLKLSAMLDGITGDFDKYRKTAIADLAMKYFHRMADDNILTQSPIQKTFTYKVVPQGPDQAPKLTDWDFSEYDKGVEGFLKKRNIPWFAAFHTNGHQMDKLRLSDGKFYSPNPPQGTTPWVQLPLEEFNKLLADYFGTLATHLEKQGVLDRAFILVDESDPSTYETILNFARAVRSTPAGQKLKFGHTTYKPSTYSLRKKDGELYMDEILDLPMPENDDHFNFFEPEFHARFKRPGKESWVYNVETDHMSLLHAGVSTALMPLKLHHFGVTGWYCWASFIWSMPYPIKGPESVGQKYPSGPVINPWVNPFYHHGPGVLSFFYPPNPSGPADQPTDRIIPSWRLGLLRDGIQAVALLDIARKGTDDAGNPVVVQAEKLKQAEETLAGMLADNPVQWHPSAQAFAHFLTALHAALSPAPTPSTSPLATHES